MIGKVFIGILALFLLFGAFSGPILDGIKGWRTQDTTEAFIVTTGGGVTTDNVTLALELYQDQPSEVIAIDTTEVEVPVATSYDSTTQNLLISALNAGATRTLTVEYYGLPDDDVMGAIGPFLGFLVIGGLAFAVLWGIWKGKH